MPNICLNDLTVHADDSVLDRFEKVFFVDCDDDDDKDDDNKNKPRKMPTKRFSLNALVPMPKDWDAVKVECRNGLPKWYEWCIENWGTKSVYATLCITRSTRILHVAFESAWAPPLPWFKTLCETFDEEFSMTLAYEEPAMDIHGVLVCKKWKKSRDGDYFYLLQDVALP